MSDRVDTKGGFLFLFYLDRKTEQQVPLSDVILYWEAEEEAEESWGAIPWAPAPTDFIALRLDRHRRLVSLKPISRKAAELILQRPIPHPNIVDRVLQAMASARTTRRELSTVTGIPYRTLQNYLLGIHEMPAEALRRICRALDISADWILNGVEAPP